MSLNVYGWSALIGTGLVLGTLAGLVTPFPLWISLAAGVLATWVVVLGLDRQRFRNSTIHLCRDSLDHDSGAVIVADLQAMGITTSYHEYALDDEDGGGVQRGILCRQRDLEAAERIMSEHLA